MVESIKQQVAKIDSGVGLANVRTLETALGNSFAQRRLILYLIGGFAIAATLLACIGLYGVMSYTVATRQREWASVARSEPLPAPSYGKWSSMAAG